MTPGDHKVVYTDSYGIEWELDAVNVRVHHTPGMMPAVEITASGMPRKTGKVTPVIVNGVPPTPPPSVRAAFGLPPTHGGYPGHPNGRPDTKVTVKVPKIPKCECGKEKHGFANHADWCDIKN